MIEAGKKFVISPSALSLIDRLIGGEAVQGNIFSLGAKRRFENPISDMLAFFLDSEGCHGLGDIFLKGVLQSLNVFHEDAQVLGVRREILTHSGKRIDILVELSESLIVIENKTISRINNPLDEYSDYVKRAYPGKRVICAVLAPGTFCVQDGWCSLTYDRLVKEVEQGLDKAPRNDDPDKLKWYHFAKDFISFMKEEFGMTSPMSDQDFMDVEKEISALYNAVELKKKFIDEASRRIIYRLEKEFSGNNFSISVYSWKEGPAFSVGCNAWHNESAVVLYGGYVSNDDYEVRVYLDSPEDSRVKELSGSLKAKGFLDDHWCESGNRWYVQRIDNRDPASSSRLSDFNEALQLLVELTGSSWAALAR